jgi:type II secretory pathway pseudopilin PulG
MKNSPLTTTLLVVLAISAVLSLYFCWSYMKKSAELRALRFQVTQINARGAAINQVLNDVLEYSKKNHDIDKVLESLGMNLKAVTNNPSGK